MACVDTSGVTSGRSRNCQCPQCYARKCGDCCEGKINRDLPRPNTPAVSAETYLRPAPSSDHPSWMMAVGLEVLDLLNIGVAVINKSRQLLFANQTAHQILGARDGLEVSSGGILGSRNKDRSSSLGEVLQRVAVGLHPDGRDARGTVLAVQRASGKRPLTLLIRSLMSEHLQSDARVPAVLIFVWDPELPIGDTEVRLRQLFGLTSCEARLANLLMEGRTLDDCCIHLGIRASTARMHLSNLLAKTGVQRQGQLISLLWKSVGMVRTESDPSRSDIDAIESSQT
jgi:DNA-binding CsgD family transcriptional regulator